MGYSLPLKFIKVSTKRKQADGRAKNFDVAICATRIVAIMSAEINQAKKAIANEKKAGTLINACSLAAAKSVVILDNGAVVASPLSVGVILRSIERSATKGEPRGNISKYKVYDVYEKDEDEIEEAEADAIEDDDFVYDPDE